MSVVEQPLEPAAPVRSKGQHFLWAYIWLMSLKLALEWASILESLVRLSRIATMAVHWWRSLYYPFIIHLGFHLPHWAMDVLGIGFALANISAAAMAIKSQKKSPGDQTTRLRAIFLTFTHYVKGTYLLVKDIVSLKIKKAVGRLIKNPVAHALSLTLDASILLTIVSAAMLNIDYLKWSALSLAYSVMFIIIYVSCIAVDFDISFFGRRITNVYPIRWVLGALLTTFLLNFAYETAIAHGWIDQLSKQGLV